MASSFTQREQAYVMEKIGANLMDQLKTIGAKYIDQPIYEEFQIEMNRISEICHYFQLIFFTCESCESLLKRKRKRRAHKKASWQSTWNNTKEILLRQFSPKVFKACKTSFLWRRYIVCCCAIQWSPNYHMVFKKLFE